MSYFRRTMIRILFLLIALVGTKNVLSQSISWAFSQSCYTTDTSLTKYLYPGVYSVSQLDSAYNRFCFTSNEMYGSYPEIQTGNNIQNCAGGAFELNFSLHGKSSKTYFYKNDSANKSTAIFFIPGTGSNQSSQILSNVPANYHNYYNGVFYGLPALCKKHGDFFLYIKPNEDIRAIRYNFNKLSDTHIYPVLTNRGTSYTSNLFIECMAIIKYLKSKYKRVIVFGLSQGATSSMIAGVESEPDAVLSCSGYSTMWDTAFYASGTPGLIQDSLFEVYSSKNILDSMKAQACQYFYSWASNDVTSLIQEYFNHVSENTWGTHCNVQYHYGIYNHAIPFVAADTFLSRANRRPTIKIESPGTVCIADSASFKLKLTGTAPFTFDLYRDSTFVTSYSSSDTEKTITLYQEGKYQIRNLIDQNNLPLCHSREFFYIKSVKPSIQWNYAGRDCDNHLDSIKLSFSGQAPFTLLSALPGISPTFQTNQTNFTLGIPKGNYPVISIIDSSWCTTEIIDTIRIVHDTLKSSFGMATYSCDSLKTKWPLTIQGIAPFQVDYFENGIAKNLLTWDAGNELWVQNGLTILSIITDSAGCQLPLNHSQNFNYFPIQFNGVTRSYQCDSVKEQIHFAIQANYPVSVHYRKNLQPDSLILQTPTSVAFFGNGNYTLDSIRDYTGCFLALSEAFTILHDTLELQLYNPVYNCDSMMSLLPITLEGHAPFTLNFTKNGFVQQTVLTQWNDTLYLSNGSYSNFIVTDSFGCQQNSNAFYVIQNDTLEAIWLSSNFICDSSKTLVHWEFEGNPPFSLFYLKNGIPDSISGLQQTGQFFQSNATYQYQTVRDQTGCLLGLNHNEILDAQNLTVQLGPPLFDCDSNQTRINLNLTGNPPYQLNYLKNGQWFTQIFTQDTNVVFWPNGLYSLINLSDATNCTKVIGQAYLFNYQPVSIVWSPQSFNCDSNKANTYLTLTGNPPYSLDFIKNGQSQQITLMQDTLIHWSNGNYQFQSLTDQTGCIVNASQVLNLNYEEINWTMNQPVYNCDSNKTLVEFNFNGNPPFTLNYSMNGIATQETVLTDTFRRLVNNGIYIFQSVKDATHCTKNINQYFNFSFQPLAFSIPTQFYDCDSNKYRVNWQFQGNGPWTVTYSDGIQTFTKNFFTSSASLFLPNGNWILQAVSDQNCSKIISIPLAVNFQELSAQVNNQAFHCDSNKMAVSLSLTGNAPWKLNYTKLGTVNQTVILQFQQPNPTIFLAQGDYILNHVMDNVSCIFPLNHFVSYTFDTLSAIKNLQQYDCDSGKLHVQYLVTGAPPVVLKYRDLLTGTITQIQAGNGLVDLYLPTSSYVVEQVSDVYCTRIILDTILHPVSPLQFLSAWQKVQCDSGKMEFFMNFQGGQAPYQVSYSYNGGPTLQWVSGQPSLQRILENGQYHMTQLQDALGCQIPLNYLLDVNYQSMSDSAYTWKYPCFGDSTIFTTSWYHSGGVQLNFMYNNQADSILLAPGQSQFKLANGNYLFQALKDSAGCLLSLKDTFTLRNEPSGFHITSVEAHCPLQKHILYYKNEGLYPWTLNFNQQNITSNTILSDSAGFLLLNPDFYRLNYIEDGNQCRFQLDSSLILPVFASTQPLLRKENNDLISPDSGRIWYWYQDNNLIDSTLIGRLMIPGNGSFYFKLIDLNGCEVISNLVDLSDIPSVSLFPNPATSSVRVQVSMPFDDYWNYSVRDASGRTLLKGISETHVGVFDVSSLSTGIYFMHLNFTSDAEIHSEVIRFLKQ